MARTQMAYIIKAMQASNVSIVDQHCALSGKACISYLLSPQLHAAAHSQITQITLCIMDVHACSQIRRANHLE